MRLGQGIAFVVGMSVAGVASALLLGSPSERPQQTPPGQSPTRIVTTRHRANTGGIDLTKAPALAGAIARVGRSLLATYPTFDWFFDEGLGIAVAWSAGDGIDEWQAPEIYAFGPPRLEPQGDSAAARCRHNLAQIDAALRVWARATGSPGGTILPMEELILRFPQLASLSVCPRGGQYLGEDGTAAFAVGEIPRCTLGGSHSLP